MSPGLAAQDPVAWDGLDPVGFVTEVRRRVDVRLDAALDTTVSFTRSRAPDALPMLLAARDLTLRGGKRLRPALLFAAFECVDPAPWPEAAVDIATALELLQTYLLVHDDWMDGDPVRRGAPSVHVLLTRHYGDAHVGACTAILAGDLMGALVHDLIGRADLTTTRRRAVVEVFSRMEMEVILGQCLDVTRSPEVERIQQLKTGSYTVRGPLLLGHAIGGGGESSRRALDLFAGPLGVAFQCRDDLLGAFGSEAETGKPVGGDFREGKQTELVTHARATLPPADRARLDALYGRADLDETEVAAIRSLLDAAGAREHAERRIASLREQCLATLDEAELSPRGRGLLRWLTLALTDRTR